MLLPKMIFSPFECCLQTNVSKATRHHARCCRFAIWGNSSSTSRLITYYRFRKCTHTWSRRVPRSVWIPVMNLITLSIPCAPHRDTTQARVRRINMHALNVWLHCLVRGISNQSCLHDTSERSQEVSAYDGFCAAGFGEAVISLRQKISDYFIHSWCVKLLDDAKWFN